MARYNYTDNQPVLISKATINNMIVTNPSDELLDANNIGHVLQTAEAPEITDDTKKLSHSYTLENNVIIEHWDIVSKTTDELVSMYKSKIQDIYNEAEQYKINGKIHYDTTNKDYCPRWVYEFYNSVVIFQSVYFPEETSTVAIAAVDGTSDDMTLTQFLALYNFIATTYTTYTATQNTQIAEYNAKIKELEN